MILLPTQYFHLIFISATFLSVSLLAGKSRCIAFAGTFPSTWIKGRDVPMGAWGRCVPQYFQICKKVGQKSAMLQESWPQYFL